MVDLSLYPLFVRELSLGCENQLAGEDAAVVLVNLLRVHDNCSVCLLAKVQLSELMAQREGKVVFAEVVDARLGDYKIERVVVFVLNYLLVHLALRQVGREKRFVLNCLLLPVGFHVQHAALLAVARDEGAGAAEGP